MTLDSSNEVVAILYDIENAPFEMLGKMYIISILKEGFYDPGFQ